jgi:hypothetical protein
MAKYDFEAAVAFATQTAEGTFDPTLDAITTTLTASDGLILGASGNGVGDTGIDFGLGRSSTDASPFSGSFTRAISSFLKAEVPTFTFAFPFVGNRADAATPVVDADCTPMPGFDALLEGVGMVGIASVTTPTVGWSYTFGSPFPISCLLHISGNRFELLDCRCTLSINFTAGEIPVATATIAVGSIKDHSAAAVPTTLTYDVAGVTAQSSVSAPSVVSVAHDWQDTRGFQTLTLDIAPNIEDIPDSNTSTGITKEASDRTTTISGTMFEDDTADKIMGYTQITAAAVGTLDQLDFTVPPVATDGNPVKAVQIIAPYPEAQTYGYTKLGTKSGGDVSLILRGSAANDELEINFL